MKLLVNIIHFPFLFLPLVQLLYSCSMLLPVLMFIFYFNLNI